MKMKEAYEQQNIPAFPRDNSLPDWSGMTLRDYFAAKAMVKLMGTEDIHVCCESAYEWADAMMKAREA